MANINCPNCGSNNITFQREQMRTGPMTDKQINVTVAVCQDCGKTWVVPQSSQSPQPQKSLISRAPTSDRRKTQNTSAIIIVCLCTFLFISVIVSALSSDKQTDDVAADGVVQVSTLADEIEITPTPEPTATPAPTATPRPTPIPTPQITAIPKAVSAPDSTSTFDETLEPTPEPTPNAENRVALICDVDNDEASKITEIVKSVGLSESEIRGIEKLEDGKYSVQCTLEITNPFNVYIDMADGAVKKIYSDEYTYYSKGKVRERVDDRIVSTLEKSELRILTELNVRNNLQHPILALFIGKWNYSKSKGVYTVSSTVDHQNLFGAIIKEKFTMKFKRDKDGNFDITAAKIGDVKYRIR